jgi:hypothetical protein
VTAVRFVLVLLLANAAAAFVVLQAVPDRTEDLFVWTIHPAANARVLGVMYGNAFLLAVTAWPARSWAAARTTMAVVAPFSLAATAVTFVTLDPFLDHPWYEVAYWLLNYGILCIVAPLELVRHERTEGGRLAVSKPLGKLGRGLAALLAAGSLLYGISLLFELGLVSDLWPFAITPLVSRILGVWLGSLGLAHALVAWDGDRRRARPLAVATPLTGLLLALVPALHTDDLRDARGPLVAYLALAGAMTVAGLVWWAMRPRARPVSPDGGGRRSRGSPSPVSL